MTTPHILSPMNQVPPTDLSTKLCSWQRKCPCLSGDDRQFCSRCVDGGHNSECAYCGGTGLVYVLDGVRVLCGHNLRHPYNARAVHSPSCPGYIPSTRKEVWEQAIFKAWPESRLEIDRATTRLVFPYWADMKDAYWTGQGHDLPALQSALNQIREKEQRADA